MFRDAGLQKGYRSASRIHSEPFNCVWGEVHCRRFGKKKRHGLTVHVGDEGDDREDQIAPRIPNIHVRKAIEEEGFDNDHKFVEKAREKTQSQREGAVDFLGKGRGKRLLCPRVIQKRSRHAHERDHKLLLQALFRKTREERKESRPPAQARGKQATIESGKWDKVRSGPRM